jgi:cellulose synthase/poly-beta-1,6-N-acetylglucosamine synthase-like glycosyltransferase
LGYQVGAIEATTYEDAPLRLGNWLGQRTRWMKGWMQTTAVFLRAPRRHFREIGSLETYSALFAMASLIAGPLFGPFYGLRIVWDMVRGDLLAPAGFPRLALAANSLAIALFGALAFFLPALVGMRRRGIKPSPRLLLLPAYLALLSAAAWRALWEWTRHPFRWNKTDHVPHPQTPDQAAAMARNFPARVSAIRARIWSRP